MRSSSVAPFGIGDGARPSRRCRCSMSSASRRPPAVPTKRPPRVDDAARVVAHGERRRDALVDPLLAAVGGVEARTRCRRPRTRRPRRRRRAAARPPRSRPSPSTSACRRRRTRARRPCRCRRRRSIASAPTPAESALPAAMRHTWRPVRGIEAHDRAVGRRGVDRVAAAPTGAKPGTALPTDDLPVDRRRGRRLELRQRAGLLAVPEPAQRERRRHRQVVVDRRAAGERDRASASATRRAPSARRRARASLISSRRALPARRGRGGRRGVPAVRAALPPPAPARARRRGAAQRVELHLHVLLYGDLASSLASAVWYAARASAVRPAAASASPRRSAYRPANGVAVLGVEHLERFVVLLVVEQELGQPIARDLLQLGLVGAVDHPLRAAPRAPALSPLSNSIFASTSARAARSRCAPYLSVELRHRVLRLRQVVARAPPATAR